MSDQLIHKVINAVMKDVPFISKDGENKSQNFKFRGIDQVYAALQPAFVKHGLMCAQKVIDRNVAQVTTKTGTVMNHVILIVEHTFYALDGSNVTATTTGEAMDAGDKACSKALSVAMKYAAFSTFCIPTNEEDADLTSHEIAGRPHTTPEQRVGRPVAPSTPPTRTATTPTPTDPSAAGMGVIVESVHEDEEGKITSVVFSNVYCHSVTKDGTGIKLGGGGSQSGSCEWLSFTRKDGSATGLETDLEYKGTGQVKVPMWLLEGQFARQPLAAVWANYLANPAQANQAAEQEPLADEDIPF